MNTIWEQVYWNNTVKSWLVALGILMVLFIAIKVFKNVVINKLKKWSGKTQTSWDDFLVTLIDKAAIPLAYLGSFYFTTSSLNFSKKVGKAIQIIILLAVTYFVLRIITAIIKRFIFSFIRHREQGDKKEKQANGLVIILNGIIWIFTFIFLIDNLGYNVTTLITGLGIGGIAIALAAQAILGDLFSYFVIFFDHPFEIGDFIVVDDKMGTVEYIGIKTTCIRSLSGEQLIFSNSNLTNSRLHNYKSMERRRQVFNLGIIYQSSYEMLKKVPAMVKKIIESKELVQFDRGHFSGFGNSSLNFEFVYYIESPDDNTYMDKQQSIYLDIFKIFEQEKIDFAYPTQTLFINPNGAF